jgi:HK97 gp10 family phage protein
MAATKEFDGITGFLLHLAAVEIAVHKAAHHALDRAAAVIEADAKGQIGTYQQQAGPFNAWPELAESTQKDRERKGFTPNDPLLRSGELRDSISREISDDEAAVGSTSDVMVYQELGTPTIPPRPVLGPAAFKNKDKIERILGEAVVHALEYGAAGAFVALPD